MTRASGDTTRKVILQAAERLFAQKGVDATSVDSIAKAAKVNKALIYYHFKNKADLVVSLFNNIIEELDANVEDAAHSSDIAPSIKEAIAEEIRLMEPRKRVLSVILMESLKNGDKNNFLFTLADMSMMKEMGPKATAFAALADEEQMKIRVHEFFTGFLPLVMFMLLRDKWSSFYRYDKDSLLREFLDAFERTHLDSKEASP